MLSILLLLACTPKDSGAGEKDADSGCEVATWYADLDGDGVGAAALEACVAPQGYVTTGGDCDDGDAAVRPGVEDGCDGVDQDCDGTADEDAAGSTWYVDADGDGYGDDTTALTRCEAPVGAVSTGDDCDDTDPDIHPGAPEVDCADPVDYNCDGSVVREDQDADGWAACEDCDDQRADIFPGASETCDGTDEDCDAEIDEDVGSRWYEDADGDGFGVGEGWLACTGDVSNADDCDDASAERFPGADERCDDTDDDCDGAVDEGATDAAAWYSDADGDGHGDPSAVSIACDAPPGTVVAGDDCDDTDASASPEGVEVCGGGDEDCDGLLDEDVGSWRYVDADGDGWGTGEAYLACAGGVDNAEDCDDTSAAVNPGAAERCDGVDDDCDGTIDVGAVDEGTWYADVDGDGFGAGEAYTACEGEVDNAADCDDADPTVHPAAAEVCDGADQDCDDVVDEGVSVAWYIDADGDGHGGATLGDTCSEAPPLGYTSSYTDCDDTRAQAYPGAPEVCDGVRDDCSVTALEEDGLVTWEGPDGAWADLTAEWAGGSTSGSVAVNLPAEGTVHVCPGTWYVALTAPSGADTTVQGHGADVVLDAGYDGSNLALTDETTVVRVEDLALTKGAADRGGALYNPGGAARFDRVEVSNGYSTASDGGLGMCVYAEGGHVELVDTSFEVCNGGGWYSGDIGGMMYAVDTDVVMERVYAYGVSAEYAGGVYWTSTTDAALTVTDSEVSSADADREGGAFYVVNDGTGTARIEGTEVLNSGAYSGGGFYLTGTGPIELSDITLENNGVDHYGGGVYVIDAPALTLDGLWGTKNDAGYGAGVYFASDGAITNSTFYANGSIFQYVYHGVGIAVGPDAVVDIADTTFTENLTMKTSAGLYVGSGADVTCTRCTFEDNIIDQNASCSGVDPESPTCGGGAVMVVGSLRLVDSRISGTTMDLGSGPGGGVLVYGGDVVLERTIIEDNTAPYGGGVFLHGGSLTLDSGSAIRDNTSSAWGGGVYMSGGTVSCSDTDGSGTPITGNVGGAFYLDTSSENALLVNGCDLGASGAADDNTSASGSPTCDVYVVSSGWYTYGDDATFNCSATGCL